MEGRLGFLGARMWAGEVFGFASAQGLCLSQEDGFISLQCCFSFLGTLFVTR